MSGVQPCRCGPSSRECVATVSPSSAKPSTACPPFELFSSQSEVRWRWHSAHRDGGSSNRDVGSRCDCLYGGTGDLRHRPSKASPHMVRNLQRRLQPPQAVPSRRYVWRHPPRSCGPPSPTMEPTCSSALSTWPDTGASADTESPPGYVLFDPTVIGWYHQWSAFGRGSTPSAWKRTRTAHNANTRHDRFDNR